MIDSYLETLAGKRGERIAKVTAAKELSSKQSDKLAEQLKKLFGGKVELEIEVDPALIGGLKVRVGSRLVDSSVQSKLRRLETMLKGA